MKCHQKYDILSKLLSLSISWKKVQDHSCIEDRGLQEGVTPEAELVGDRRTLPSH